MKSRENVVYYIHRMVSTILQEKKMRVGLQIGITNTHPKPLSDYLIRVAEQADQAGFATLVVPDHFSLRPETTPFLKREKDDTPTIDFFEAWSVLAFLAARTRRIRLSTLVFS